MRRIDYVAAGFLLATGAFMILGLTSKAGSAVIQEADRTYLVDRLGERWDITQAASIGFDPRGFEFGIGREAFTPLAESDWRQGDLDSVRNQRVIGVDVGGQAHAYSVSKLVHHETANTVIGSQPIVVGY